MVSQAQVAGLTIAICFVAATIAAQPNRGAARTASLSGSVSDQRLEQPLEGVTVVLRQHGKDAETRTKTDADGRYSFTQITTGDYHVIAAHRSYIAQHHGIAELTNMSAVTPEGLVTVAAGEQVTGIDFKLVKGATIRGRITSPEGQPIDGVVVSTLMVAGTDSLRYTRTIIDVAGQNRTSATGEFVLEGLADGSYQVSAMPPPKRDAHASNDSEFQTTYFPGTPREQASAIRVTSEEVIAGIDFPLLRDDLLSISGQVVRSESEGRIEGFVVTSDSSRRLVVENDGTFRAVALKPGRYTIWLRARTPSGFEAASETIDAFAHVPALQLHMSSTATIAGRVTTVDGTPLPVDGVRVAAVLTADGIDVDAIARDQAEVGGDGSFAIGGVFGDRTIRLIGLPAGWEIERIAGARRNPLRLTLGERVEIIVVIGHAAIRGRVTTAEGQPLANARVTATMVDASGSADPSGTKSATTAKGTPETGDYTLRGLSDGLYVLEARIETPRDPRSGLLLPGEPEFVPSYYPGGSRDQAVAVRVSRGEVVSNITIPLTRQVLASITGHIVRRDHETRLDAHLLAPGSADQAVPIEADGRFTVPGLKPGRYAMWARTPTVTGLEAAFALVDLATDAIEVDLVMAPTATINGRIIATDGTTPPLANVRVAAAWTHAGKDVDVVWRDQSAVDADGGFQLEGLFGERTLQVIDLPRGWTIDGVMQDGHPAASVRLSAGAHADVTIFVRAAGGDIRDTMPSAEVIASRRSGDRF